MKTAIRVKHALQDPRGTTLGAKTSAVQLPRQLFGTKPIQKFTSPHEKGDHLEGLGVGAGVGSYVGFAGAPWTMISGKSTPQISVKVTMMRSSEFSVAHKMGMMSDIFQV
jgi:hypothetical protein